MGSALQIQLDTGETYLLTSMRYIELNFVRAGMMQDPGQYRWSSYLHNGLGQPDPRITAHPLYLTIDRDGTERQTAYRVSDSEQERMREMIERQNNAKLTALVANSVDSIYGTRVCPICLSIPCLSI